MSAKHWTLRQIVEAIPEDGEFALLTLHNSEGECTARWIIPRQSPQFPILGCFVKYGEGHSRLDYHQPDAGFVTIMENVPFKLTFPTNLRLEVGMVIK